MLTNVIMFRFAAGKHTRLRDAVLMMRLLRIFRLLVSRCLRESMGLIVLAGLYGLDWIRLDCRRSLWFRMYWLGPQEERAAACGALYRYFARAGARAAGAAPADVLLLLLDPFVDAEAFNFAFSCLLKRAIASNSARSLAARSSSVFR